MDDILQQGIAALKAGDKENARRLLITAVKQMPDNERAWGWLYNAAQTDEERLACLKQVLRINPENKQAKELLEKLAGINFPFNQEKSLSAHQKTLHGEFPFSINLQNVIKILSVVFLLGFILWGILWIDNNVSYETLWGHPQGYSWNNLSTVTQGGVSIEVARLAIYKKSSLSKNDQQGFDNVWPGVDTICDLYFKITNNTNVVMSVYADQGLAMINDEQIQLSSYMFSGNGTLGGEIFPGATVTGVMTFGLKRVTPDLVNKMVITISSPHDKNFYSYGQDYVFYLDLSRHEWMPKPDYLK